MAQIPRPPKQGNVMTYVAKVAAGYPHILAGEVDADLDTIYGAWNGGADTVNIRDGAVTSAKLAADSVGPRELQDSGIATANLGDAAVTTPKIADGAVTDPKIVSVAWAKVTGGPAAFPPGGAAGGDLAGTYPNPTIRPGAVTSATLAAGSIGTRELADLGVNTGDLAAGAVTLSKIGLGQTLQALTGQARTDTMPMTTVGAEYPYLDYTWQSRGGPYVILAGLHCVLGLDTTTPSPELVARIRLDGTAGVADGPIVQEMVLRELAVPVGTIVVPAPLTLAFSSTSISAGTHRIKITAFPAVKIIAWVRVISGWSVMAEWA